MDKAKFTSQSPIVVGLDIGTTKICVIVGRRTQHGKIEILGIGKAESAGVTHVEWFLTFKKPCRVLLKQLK
jgi:cell division protein FtsA